MPVVYTLTTQNAQKNDKKNTLNQHCDGLKYLPNINDVCLSPNNKVYLIKNNVTYC